MALTPDLVEELNTLLRFDLDTNQLGIKIHHDADPVVIAAARRLHAKGMISQVDGGYLTRLGREAAEHAQTAMTLLVPAAPHTLHNEERVSLA